MVIEKEQLIQWVKDYDYDHYIKERLIFELEFFSTEPYVILFKNEEHTKDFAETYKIRCKIAELPENEELRKRYNGHFYRNLKKSSNATGEIYSLGLSLGSLAFYLYFNESEECLFLNILELDGLGYNKKSLKIKRKNKISKLMLWLRK